MDLRSASVVLDVGPGIRPQSVIRCAVHILLEPHRPYLDAVAGDYIRWNATWEAMALLPDAAVDTVVALDFIEHLTKADGRRFLAEAARVASSQVVIFTPLGFMRQDQTGPTDAWGMGGMAWQRHRSGWTPEDFDGYEVEVLAGFCREDENGPRAVPVDALWAVRSL